MATDQGPRKQIIRDDDFNYPWIDWLNGHLWELVPGQDFQESVPTFRARAYRAMKRVTISGDRVRTKFNKKTGVLYLQAFTFQAGQWVPIDYNMGIIQPPAPPADRTGQDHSAPSAPPVQPDGWTPEPPHQPR